MASLSSILLTAQSYPKLKLLLCFTFPKLCKLKFCKLRTVCKHNATVLDPTAYRQCVGSSVSTVTTLRSAQPTNRGLTPGRGKTFFLCSKASTLPTGPTRPPLSGHWGLFLQENRPECEVGHTYSPSAEVTHQWSCTETPPICMHGVHRVFSFTLANMHGGALIHIIVTLFVTKYCYVN